MSRISRSVLAWSLLAALGATGCDRVPLLAPTNTTIRLISGLGVLPIAGSTEITAIVIESAGTPVQNGTVVTFTSSLGTVEPREARTSNGQVTVRYIAGTQSGSAKIGAFSGGSKSEDIEILVGAAAAGAVSLRTDTPIVPSTGGTADIIATVVDTGGNPLRGAPVRFTSTFGQLSQSTALTNDAGEALTQLTTNVTAEVTARIGSGTTGEGGTTAPEAKITITARDLPLVGITLVGGLGPNTTEVGQPTIFALEPRNAATSSAIRSVRVDFGDGGSTTLGALIGVTNVSHLYSRTGTFTVTATATDAINLTGVSTLVVQVNDRGTIPVTFTQSALPGNVINFSATATPRAGSSIRVYEWDFGDGISATTTGPITSHRYVTTNRTYRVTLRVVATNGDVGFTEGDVRIP